MDVHEQADRLNILVRFLCRRDTDPFTARDKYFDVIVLCGNACLRTIQCAGDLMLQHRADHLVIAGGFGHASQPLFDNVNADVRFERIPSSGRSEAEVIQDVLAVTHPGLGPCILDTRSTHCGENASCALEELQAVGITPATALVIQDPVMQYRTHMSFIRHWRDTGCILSSFAVMVPLLGVENNQLTFSDLSEAYCAVERFVPLVMGELQRLNDDEQGYGPRGADFIDHVELPENILDAYDVLDAVYPDWRNQRSWLV